jgi:hypothetical protein
MIYISNFLIKELIIIFLIFNLNLNYQNYNIFPNFEYSFFIFLINNHSNDIIIQMEEIY